MPSTQPPLVCLHGPAHRLHHKEDMGGSPLAERHLCHVGYVWALAAGAGCWRASHLVGARARWLESGSLSIKRDFSEEWLHRLNTTCGRVTTYRGVQLVAALVLWFIDPITTISRV